MIRQKREIERILRDRMKRNAPPDYVGLAATYNSTRESIHRIAKEIGISGRPHALGHLRKLVRVQNKLLAFRAGAS